MDDDPFDTSVWSTPEPAPSTSKAPEPPTPSPAPAPAESQSLPSDIPASPTADDSFDDFDDFSQPSAPVPAEDAADFGDDFGDFGETVEEDIAFSQEHPEPEPAPPPEMAKEKETYHPLVLDPFPSQEELQRQIDDLLGPLFPIDRAHFSDEPIREVEGLGQILITPGSRELYRTLTEIPPEMTRPINWTRSRIRRQQLIALGVPVNLDEVLPTSSAKPLPTLHITTSPTARPASAPPGRPSTPAGVASRAATPIPGGRTPRTGPPPLGPAPKMDMDKAEEVLRYSESQLSILPLTAVESHLANIRGVTEQANALLAHLLQSRDVLQQDSETYNRLIAELVGEAQKVKAPPTSRWGRRKEKSGSMMSAS